jgi:hypothetical protein
VIPTVKKPTKSPVLKSLQSLISAAEHMNPTQFELPYELTQPIPFPGTDKGKILLFNKIKELNSVK